MAAPGEATAGDPRPFFEAPGGSSAARRLLLVSPLFPPDQQVGALRWQKMAHYAVERGWEIDVITVHPDCIDSPDWSRLADLPPGIRLYGVQAPVLRFARVLDRVWSLVHRSRSTAATSGGGTASPTLSFPRSELRWSLTSPRAYVRMYNLLYLYANLRRWARDAFALARRLVVQNAYDAVISSGPPNEAHEAARLISRHTGLPFVMDMRDVWSLVERCAEPIASPLIFHLTRWLERRAVHQASLVIANTEPARAKMARLYPERAERILTVTNGFDEEPFPRSRHGNQFVIAYAGTIYLNRDPRLLFRAARQVIDELDLSPDHLALSFIGVNDWGTPLSDIAASEGVADFLTVTGSRPRAEALEFLARATMLLILPQDTDLAIPAKVFEYMRCDAWLLALVESDSATGLLLRDTAADVVPPADVRGIASVIRTRYQQFVAGTRPRRVATDTRLSRRFQAQRLLDGVEEVARPSRSQRRVYSAAS